MDLTNADGKRGSRQAKPRCHDFYPKWGMEEPSYVSNAHELFRYGEPGFLTRYIVPPADVVDKRRHEAGKPLLGNRAYELLRHGFAVEDVVIGIAVGAIMALLLLLAGEFFGVCFDECADKLGW